MISKCTTAVGAGLFLALLASGCGGGESENGGAPAPVKSTPNANQNQVKLTPRDQVQEGGTFTFPLDSMPANFNYNQLDGTDQMNHFIIGGMLPQTFVADAAGTPIWNPDYLASEPKLTLDPKQVVTFEINPKAIWYDGTPITWEDFYWQWKASGGTNPAYQISGSQGFEDIENVEKGKDVREVIVTFKRRFADWQAIFNLMVPVSTNKDPKIFNDGWRDQPLSTAGPFKLDHIDKTAKTVTLVRNEKWWGARAKVDRILFRVIEPDAQIDALANGEIDSMDMGTDANKFNRSKSIGTAEIRFAGGPNFTHITINSTGQNLTDQKTRLAIAKGIDRASIGRALLGPLGIEIKTLNNHIYMGNQEGYQDNSGDTGKFEPERARQLLDEAGWKLEGTVRKKNGKALDINFVIPAGIATSKQVAELVQNMLGQIGVTLKISSVPSNDFFSKYVTPGQFDLTLFSWIGTPYPISSTKSIYGKPTKDPKGELDIKQNYSRIGSDEIDRLYVEANAELDRKKAEQLGNQIDALVWQEVHSLTLYQRPELFLCKKNLVNFGAFGFADWKYEDIGWLKTP